MDSRTTPSWQLCSALPWMVAISIQYCRQRNYSCHMVQKGCIISQDIEIVETCMIIFNTYNIFTFYSLSYFITFIFHTFGIVIIILFYEISFNIIISFHNYMLWVFFLYLKSNSWSNGYKKRGNTNNGKYKIFSVWRALSLTCVLYRIRILAPLHSKESN